MRTPSSRLARAHRACLVSRYILGNNNVGVSKAAAIGGGFSCAARRRSCRLDSSHRQLPGAAILLNIERDLLALDQPAHSGAFKRRGVNENILAAIVRLNEAEAFLIVVELDGTRIHRSVLSLTQLHFAQAARQLVPSFDFSMFGRV